MNLTNRNTPQPVLADAFSELPGIGHGFFTREGGVSTGIYAGLNVGLGSSDDPACITENRGRVASHLGFSGDALLTPHQVHSPDVVVADASFDHANRPHADAIVCHTPGMIVGVLTADCGPVLFADPARKVIAAAHAGWKGALGGVLENTIDAMIGCGAHRPDIVAVLGPTISRTNYEVGAEFRDRFIDVGPANSGWFSKSVREDHFMFDLPGYIVSRLQSAGISASSVGLCTYEDENRFYSYRRTTHREEADYGRQISAIVLNG